MASILLVLSPHETPRHERRGSGRHSNPPRRSSLLLQREKAPRSSTVSALSVPKRVCATVLLGRWSLRGEDAFAARRLCMRICMSLVPPHGCRRGPHDAPISGATGRGPSPALRYLLTLHIDGRPWCTSHMHDEVGSETALGRNMAISTAVFADSRSSLPVPVRCYCSCSILLLWRSRRSSVCLSSPHCARLRSRRARLCSRSLRCRWMPRARSIARPSPRPAPLTVEVVRWSSVHSGPSSALQ